MSGVWQPASDAELAELVRVNFLGERKSLRPTSGLRSPHADREDRALLSTARLQRVIDYPARDMTVTVEAGMSVGELDRLLAQQGQRLPIDVPDAEHVSVGAAMATNLCGPSQFGQGSWRDAVIGMSAVDGAGRLFSAGGRVVKNVAGYDLCKLLIGSAGSLAVITQISFKLRPRPAERRCLIARSSDLATLELALSRLNISSTRPVAIELLHPGAAHQLERDSTLPGGDGIVLIVGYEGATRECDWQAAQGREELLHAAGLTGEILDAAASAELWNGLTELAARSEARAGLRARLAPSRLCEFLSSLRDLRLCWRAHAGVGTVQLWKLDTADDAHSTQQLQQELTTRATRMHGRLFFDQADSGEMMTSGSERSGQVGELLAGLKHKLDPAGVLPPLRSI